MKTFKIYYGDAPRGLQKANNAQEAIELFKKAQYRFLSIPTDSLIYVGIEALEK